MVAAVLAPLAAAGQVNPEAAPGSGQGGGTYKYEVYVGAAYSRFRQATESYSGLIGGKVSVARDWGKYFQLIARTHKFSCINRQVGSFGFRFNMAQNSIEVAH